jgi:hypothetical protein
MASEFTYTRDDGHWIVDPVELERLNRGYWRDVFSQILVDESRQKRRSLVRSWAVQVSESEWDVYYLVHLQGKNPWSYGGKSNGPFNTAEEALRRVYELLSSF